MSTGTIGFHPLGARHVRPDKILVAVPPIHPAGPNELCVLLPRTVHAYIDEADCNLGGGPYVHPNRNLW